MDDGKTRGRAYGLIPLNPKADQQRFLVGSAIASVAVSAHGEGSKTYPTEFYPAVDAPEVEVTITIVWSDDGSPVTNATIYDARTNKLLSGMDENGQAVVRAKEGDVLRLQDNVYGMQSVLKTVQGNRVFAENIKVMFTGELWVRGKPT